MSDLAFWYAKASMVRSQDILRLERLAANGKIMDRHEADQVWRGRALNKSKATERT
jgi:hypothetical protein